MHETTRYAQTSGLMRILRFEGLACQNRDLKIQVQYYSSVMEVAQSCGKDGVGSTRVEDPRRAWHLKLTGVRRNDESRSSKPRSGVAAFINTGGNVWGRAGVAGGRIRRKGQVKKKRGKKKSIFNGIDADVWKSPNRRNGPPFHPSSCHLRGMRLAWTSLVLQVPNF
jgi:hypothetical protein